MSVRHPSISMQYANKLITTVVTMYRTPLHLTINAGKPYKRIYLPNRYKIEKDKIE